MKGTGKVKEISIEGDAVIEVGVMKVIDDGDLVLLQKNEEGGACACPLNAFISASLFSVNQSRMWHWKTTSHSRHEAWGSYYDGLIELQDKFVEEYIGAYGSNEADIELLVEGVHTKEKDIEHLKTFRELLVPVYESRKVKERVNLMAILDDVFSLIDHTLYLFRFDEV